MVVSESNYIVRIANGLFKSSLSPHSKPVFSQRIGKFQVNVGERWVIYGSGKSTLLDILQRKYLGDSNTVFEYGPSVRKDRVPLRIEQLQFKNNNLPAAHLSARYEFFKDEFDQTCKSFIFDNAVTSQSVDYQLPTTNRQVNWDLYDTLVRDLNLTHLQDRWAVGLSNGQMRRARLACSLLKEPGLLLVDDPFLGLDPDSTNVISNFLCKYPNRKNGCPIIIGLRYQDTIPKWCTHICHVDKVEGIKFQGPLQDFRQEINELKTQHSKIACHEKDELCEKLVSAHPLYGKTAQELSQLPPVYSLRDVTVSYQGEPVFRGLNWDVVPGSKWHIRGANGSGKSTLLALLTAEHPQSWCATIYDNGVQRKVGRSNYFDINSRIGISSPELHAMLICKFGDLLDVRECIATGYNEASSNNFTKAYNRLTIVQRDAIENLVRLFDLNTQQHVIFNQLSVSDQKLILFIRALVKMPQVLILDEAFSGMEERTIWKCQLFLQKWPGTVLAVSHIPQETPHSTHHLTLHMLGLAESGTTTN